VLRHLECFLDLARAVAAIIHYLQQNAGPMRYGTYRQRGSVIGSGAIERAGKQLAAVRIKGQGMRWNIVELNLLLTIRCVFLDRSWHMDWKSQALLAA